MEVAEENMMEVETLKEMVEAILMEVETLMEMVEAILMELKTPKGVTEEMASLENILSLILECVTL